MSKKKEAQADSSLKIVLKIKAFEEEEKMMKIMDPHKICLTDEKTGQSEEYEYDHIFDIKKHNSDLFGYVKSSTIGKVFDNTNCCLVCIGQANSGKTFSLFGKDSRLGLQTLNTDYSQSDKNIGLVQRVFNGLVESALEFQENKEYQILISILEVHNENVRDLLAGFEDGAGRPGNKTGEKPALENLEVYESANGQLMIKNLCTVLAEEEEQLATILAYALRTRVTNSKALGYQIPSSHLVLNMNFVLRDKENYNFPSLNSTVQFIEIACQERLSATLSDPKKFQDSLYFNSQLAALQRVLFSINGGQKPAGYKESKLTKVMQNYCNQNSEVVVLCHAVPNPKEFSACLAYLNLVARFRNLKQQKALTEEVHRVAGDFKETNQIANSLTIAEEKVLKKMKEDLKELDARYEYMRREYGNNFSDVGHIIGAKENLEGLLMKKGSQFWTQFRQKRDILSKIGQKDGQLQDKDMLIIKTQRKIEELKRDLNDQLEVHIVSNYQLQDEINYLKDQIKVQLNSKNEFEREHLAQKFEKARVLAQNNQHLLNEKVELVKKFPKALLKQPEQPRISVEATRVNAFQETKQSNEIRLTKLRAQNDALIEAKRVELENILKLKNDEADRYFQRCQEKKAKKK